MVRCVQIMIHINIVLALYYKKRTKSASDSYRKNLKYLHHLMAKNYYVIKIFKIFAQRKNLIVKKARNRVH